MTTDVAQAYDALAAAYDEQVHADAWMRRLLWRRYLQCFPSGAHLLDVACGTGTDALFLAEHGYRVTGIDASSAMIDRFRAKARERGLEDDVEAHVGEATSLGFWPDQHFGGVVSAFGGLNTVSDLRAFAGEAGRVLRPGGGMVLHMVNRFSLWEWLSLLRRGRLTVALRLHAQSERTFTIGGQPVQHYLSFPRPTYRRYFADHFVLDACYSLGCLTPPPNKTWIPSSVGKMLGVLEQGVRSYWPFVNGGRFFVLEMTRRAASNTS